MSHEMMMMITSASGGGGEVQQILRDIERLGRRRLQDEMQSIRLSEFPQIRRAIEHLHSCLNRDLHDIQRQKEEQRGRQLLLASSIEHCNSCASVRQPMDKAQTHRAARQRDCLQASFLLWPLFYYHVFRQSLG
jgi:hypothetical protein